MHISSNFQLIAFFFFSSSLVGQSSITPSLCYSSPQSQILEENRPLYVTITGINSHWKSDKQRDSTALMCVCRGRWGREKLVEPEEVIETIEKVGVGKSGWDKGGGIPFWESGRDLPCT